MLSFRFKMRIFISSGFLLLAYNNCSGKIGFQSTSVDLSSGALSDAGDSTVTQPPLPPGVPQPSNPAGKLAIPFKVKEVAGVGATQFPITAVIPFPVGQYQNTSTFRVVNSAGATVPAQFEVMTRWWGKDKSLRLVAVHFQPTVSAYTGPGTGIQNYTLKDDGQNVSPVSAVSVVDSTTSVLIANGKADVLIQKSPLKIITPAGELKAVFEGAKASDIQESFNRSDIKIEVEEAGPLRAVVKLSSATQFTDRDRHRHGWALRIYSYAGQSFVKFDYQLQNADKSVKYSAPMYFNSFRLDIATGKASTPGSVKAELISSDFSSKPQGAISASNASVMIRNFYETWPNTVSVTADGKISAELWPSTSAQFYDAKISPSGLYWLEDMQASYKEVLFDFAVKNATELNNLSKTFSYPPVATLETPIYAEARAHLDAGGFMSIRTSLGSADTSRKPKYGASLYDVASDAVDGSVYPSYGFGWINFGLDVDRKLATAMTGSYPQYEVQFLLSQNPADYFSAERRLMGELNARPQWMPGYTYAADFNRLQLTENPYAGGNWRAFEGHGDKNVLPYLANTDRSANARDDQHGWFYHTEFGYNLTYNLWGKDWFKFIAEFRKTRLNQKDPYPDMSSRAIGHAISHAMQAYRVTGDPELLTLTANYVKGPLAANEDKTSGVNLSTGMGEAAFQAAYLLRALASYNEELSTNDPLVLQKFKNYTVWNLSICNYCYYVGTASNSTPNLQSGGSGEPLADMVAWYIIKTNDKAPLAHLQTYYKTGLNGGDKPYMGTSVWSGEFLNRFVFELVK